VVAWVDEQWVPVSEAGFDHEQVAVFVWRAERAGGDTKTPKSRRTLALPRKCVEALREHRVRQVKDRLSAGPLWKDNDLVFASAVGTPQDDHNVRRQFRVITEAAGLGRHGCRGSCGIRSCRRSRLTQAKVVRKGHRDLYSSSGHKADGFTDRYPHSGL
jgi:hypothetical protein